jgi:hypothetical protein
LLGNDSVNTFPRQQSHVTAATDTNATTEELIEAVFSMRPASKIYTGDGLWDPWLMHAMTLTKDRPVLSSERAPHKKKQDRNCQTVLNIWS